MNKAVLILSPKLYFLSPKIIIREDYRIKSDIIKTIMHTKREKINLTKITKGENKYQCKVTKYFE